jgi:hypothetical protein
MVAALLAILEAGPGPLALGHRRSGGLLRAAAGLAAGALGSTLAIEAGRRTPIPA